MPIYNFFKDLFGIPSGSDNTDNYRNQRSYDSKEDHKNQLWEEHEEEDYSNTAEHQDGSFQGFSMFMDPLEIHRYFEQQMDDMLKSFQGFFRIEENTPSDFSSLIEPNYPNIEQKKSDLRGQYLKPGYEHAGNGRNEKSTDTDLDGKIDIGNLDSILGDNPSSRQEITTFHPKTAPRTSYFGQSITSRRVQRPDGSIEVHKTVRDHEGNEETTITRQMGDKQYKVTTRRNKDGKEEKIEDIVNMDEKDVSQFINIWQSNQPQDDPNKYFPFDKFFK